MHTGTGTLIFACHVFVNAIYLYRLLTFKAVESFCGLKKQVRLLLLKKQVRLLLWQK